MNLITRPRAAPYYRRMLNLFGSAVIAYWPLWEASGSSAADQSGHAYNGVYVGVTLGSPGIGDGRTSPFFDGANDCVNIYSAGFSAAFNSEQGAFLLWSKVSSASVWSDATIRRLFNLTADSNNFYILAKASASNLLQASWRRGGAATLNRSFGVSDTNWMHLVITWDAVLNEYKLYYNGVQQGATLTTAGVWSGSLLSTQTAIGASGSSPSAVWNGFLAHCLVLNRPATAGEIAMASRV